MNKPFQSFLLLIFLLAGCSLKPQDASWDVIALGLPERVAPTIASINMGYYILKQTHEPLFRNDTDGEYYSLLLDSWQRNFDYTFYRFCLKKGLEFSTDQPFKISEFHDYVHKTLKKVDLNYHLKMDTDCVELSFNKSTPQILDVLASYENAPSLQSNLSKATNGLGLYRVQSISADEILLVRKTESRSGYNKIRFLRYKGPGDKNLTNHSIEDFNRIYVSEMPHWVKRAYRRFDVPLLQSINLVVNIPNDSIRKIVYDCIDVKALRQAFMPDQKTFKDISTVFPIGISGALPGLPLRSCNLPDKHNRILPELVFLNWKKGNKEPLTKTFLNFEKKTGLHIAVNDATESYLVNTALKPPHPYHLFIVALDSTRPSPIPFVGHFFDDSQRLVDFALPSGAQISEALKMTVDSKDMEKLSKEVIKLLQDNYVVLPLYQEVRDFYYPKKVKGLALTKDFLQYPFIAELRQ